MFIDNLVEYEMEIIGGLSDIRIVTDFAEVSIHKIISNGHLIKLAIVPDKSELLSFRGFVLFFYLFSTFFYL